MPKVIVFVAAFDLVASLDAGLLFSHMGPNIQNSACCDLDS